MRRQLSLFRYLRPYKRDLGLVLLLMFLGVGFEVLRPIPTKLLIDEVLEKREVPSGIASVLELLPGPDGLQGLVLWAAASTVLIFVGATVISMVAALVAIRLGQRMTYDLAAHLFSHLQRLSLLFHTRKPVGDSIARVTQDSGCLQTLLVGGLVPLVQSLLMLTMMFIVMWQLDPAMTLLSLAVVPFLFLSIRAFSGPMRDRSRERLDLEGRLMSVVQQSLSAIPAVKAFTREELEQLRFRSHSNQIVRAWMRATSAEMWFKLACGTVTALGTAGIMYLGAQRALEGKVTVGTIVVFLSYLASLYEPLNSMTYLASAYQLGAASADRVLEILNEEPETVDLPGAKEPTLREFIRYEEVTFGYEPDRPVLKTVTLEARRGQTIAIVGPTGAGKTTLVNMLLRFYEPWSGKIIVDGTDLGKVQVRSLRQQIGLVLQEPFIFPITIAENIAYGRVTATPQEIAAAAEAANADDFIRRLPEGYDTVVGERGATLSGGEKQRLSIARAFLKDAPVVILDEPTSALDARTEALLLDALERLMSGRITFIIAHRLSTIRHADHILVMDNGEIVEQGTHDELLERDGLYATLYSKQMNVTRHDKRVDLPTNGDESPWRSRLL